MTNIPEIGNIYDVYLNNLKCFCGNASYGALDLQSIMLVLFKIYDHAHL